MDGESGQGLVGGRRRWARFSLWKEEVGGA